MDAIRLTHTIPQVDSSEILSNWMTDQWNVSQTRKCLQPGNGYIESASMLVGHKSLQWDNKMLRQALATIRSMEQNLITSSPTGVSIRWDRDSWMLPRDWFINQSGMLYTSGLLSEDLERPSGISSSIGIPDKSLWFTLALNRIAGELLRKCRLYNSLGIGEDEPWLFFIRHGGLMDRTLFASISDYQWLALMRPSCKDRHPP